jgi:hypothetical protein
MNSMLDRIMKGIGAHLSDDQLSRLLSGELGRGQLLSAEEHLSKCWQCRSRREQLEAAALGFVEFRKRAIAPNLPLSARRREQFFAALRQHAEDVESSSPRLTTAYRFLDFKHMNPVIATVVIVVFAASMVFLVWQQNIPRVSASELLDRASVWDASPAKGAAQGVLYQRIRVHAGTRTLERSLYHDVEGKRHPRIHSLGAEETQLQTRLAQAGVDWNDPLSPRAYKEWRDRLQNAKDRVSRNGDGLLTLTTSSSEGLVMQSSLTVRGDDFRPIERTVGFRGAETVEITEVNHDVLSWDVISDSLFEPVAVAARSAAAPPSVKVPVPLHFLPAPPTKEQLDYAELQALLALDRANADTGEQIRVSRSGAEVLVKGIVDTEQRKQDLLSALRPIQHVSPSILGVEELNSESGPDTPPVTSVKQYFVANPPSPLEEFLQKQSRSMDDISRISRALLDASVSVDIEGGSLADLRQRFGTIDLDAPSKSAFNELVKCHLDRIRAGLNAEGQAIHEAGMNEPASISPANPPPAVEAEQFLAAIERNRTLCRELVTGGAGSARSVDAISVDLLVSLGELRAITSSLVVQYEKH